jgi:DNA-binding NarL/FixJ family response regulator
MTAKIRVLLADDQSLFREGLRTMLSLRNELEVVAEASNGDEALRLAKVVRPDVILMDLKMPGVDGVAATRNLRTTMPEVKVVALTTFEDDELIFDALRAGAIGYLLKDVSADRLVEAIHAAARGQSFLVPTVASKVVAELTRLAAQAPRASAPAAALLSPRELEVLRLLARACSNKEIAAALGLSEGTVKNHVTSIFTKLEVAGRTEAAVKARELGLL